MAQTGVIIVAGGTGNRMGGRLPKQFLLLGGKPILAHTIDNFAAALPGAQIVVVLPTSHLDFWKNFAARFEIAPHKVVEGGLERFHSVRNGLAALAPGTEIIAVQDGVRPLCSTELIRSTYTAAETHGAAIPVIEPVDSLRQIDDNGSRPIDRSRLRIVQTPQVFRAEILRQAYAADYRPAFTDDASLVESVGFPVFLCQGERQNIKVTTPEDLMFAETLLAAGDDNLDTGGNTHDTCSTRACSGDACNNHDNDGELL